MTVATVVYSKPIGCGVDHSLSSESGLDELAVLWFALFANARILFSRQIKFSSLKYSFTVLSHIENYFSVYKATFSN